MAGQVAKVRAPGQAVAVHHRPHPGSDRGSGIGLGAGGALSGQIVAW